MFYFGAENYDGIKQTSMIILKLRAILRKLMKKIFPHLIYVLQDFLAKHSALQDSAWDLKIIIKECAVAHYSWMWQESVSVTNQRLSSARM